MKVGGGPGERGCPGLRYVTPIGPVGVDIGFPLNPIDPTRDDYQVHFAIGQAF